MKKLLKRFIKLIQNEYLLLIAIIILSFGLRFYKITNPVADWHSWRQADTASVSKIFLEEGIDLLHPRYHDISTIQTGYSNLEGYRFVEFPIYNAIHAILAKNFSFLSFDTWGRMVSVLFSLLSTFLLYLIGKKLMGKWGGLLSAFFFASIPFNIYFSRVILPEPAAVSFGLLSLWLFLIFVEKDKFWALYLSGLAFSLGVLIKPFIIFYGVPMLYLAHKKDDLREIVKKRSLLIRYLVFLNLAITPLLLWRAWMSDFIRGIPHFKWAFNGDKIRFKPSFWRWIFGERLGHLILGGWGLVPFVFGLIKPKKNYFNHFFLLGMFFYIAIVASANVRHDYYQTFIIPAVALALAQGSLYLWNAKEFGIKLSRSILLFSLFIMFITGLLQVREFYRVNHPEILVAGEAVKRLIPEDSLIIAPYNGDTAFLYQTGRSGWPVVETSIDKMIARGAEYFVAVNFADPDVKIFSERFKVVEKTNQYIIIDLKDKAN